MAFTHTQGDLPGDEIEERIDHERAELCEHGVLPSLMGGRLCCKKCFDTLLTEHSAREKEREAVVYMLDGYAYDFAESDPSAARKFSIAASRLARALP
jgi:hypothetical protein